RTSAGVDRVARAHAPHPLGTNDSRRLPNLSLTRRTLVTTRPKSMEAAMARESRDVGLDSNLDRDIGISDEQDGTLRGNDSLHEVEQDTREKVYPAPLAGVEPLGGHAMHPDGDEQSV